MDKYVIQFQRKGLPKNFPFFTVIPALNFPWILSRSTAIKRWNKKVEKGRWAFRTPVHFIWKEFRKIISYPKIVNSFQKNCGPLIAFRGIGKKWGRVQEELGVFWANYIQLLFPKSKQNAEILRFREAASHAAIFSDRRYDIYRILQTRLCVVNRWRFGKIGCC